jgi:hypothetical protein
MKKRSLIFIVIIISIKVSALETVENINKRIGGHTCQQQVKKLIIDWDASGSWQMLPTFVNAGKEFTFKSPTSSIGEWVQIQFESENAITLKKMSAKTIISKKFEDKGNACNGEIVLRKLKNNKKHIKNIFTDLQLKESLRKNKKGVIYIWSPNMPLSVIGLNYLLKHAKKLGVHVTAVVDPNSPEKALSSYIQSGKVSKKSTKRLESYELIQRGAMIHYPAFFTYKNGQLSRGPKLGYEDDKQTLKFLKERF